MTLREKFERYAKEHETCGGLVSSKCWEGFYQMAQEEILELAGCLGSTTAEVVTLKNSMKRAIGILAIECGEVVKERGEAK